MPEFSELACKNNTKIRVVFLVNVNKTERQEALPPQFAEKVLLYYDRCLSRHIVYNGNCCT